MFFFAERPRPGTGWALVRNITNRKMLQVTPIVLQLCLLLAPAILAAPCADKPLCASLRSSLPAGCSLVVSGSGYCRSHKVVMSRASAMLLPASYREQCNALVRADPECASNTFSWGRVATEKGGACLCDRVADCEICGRDDAEAQVDSGNPCSLYERVTMTCEEAQPILSLLQCVL